MITANGSALHPRSARPIPQSVKVLCGALECMQRDSRRIRDLEREVAELRAQLAEAIRERGHPS